MEEGTEGMLGGQWLRGATGERAQWGWWRIPAPPEHIRSTRGGFGFPLSQEIKGDPVEVPVLY